jgi:hypothetical protein
VAEELDPLEFLSRTGLRQLEGVEPAAEVVGSFQERGSFQRTGAGRMPPRQ